jgi:hypothetical protein
MTPMNDPLPALFSSAMDQAFSQIARRVGNGYQRRLLCERRLDAGALGQIRTAASFYLAACVGYEGPFPDESDLLALLAEKKKSLPNITPNGALMPKREHTAEFNLLHKAVARTLDQVLPADLVRSMQTLMMFRIVEGTANSQRDQRPYATSKKHSDVWAGDPIDSVTLIIPVLGDPHNISVDFFEMPAHLEFEAMRPLDDYDRAGQIEPLLPYDGLDFRVGSIYFFDARLLHQTVRRASGFRISLDFRFRRALAPGEEQWLDPNAGKDRERNNPYIDYGLWKSIGTDTLLVVAESCAEARARFANPAAGALAPSPPRIVPLSTPANPERF